VARGASQRVASFSNQLGRSSGLYWLWSDCARVTAACCIAIACLGL